MTLTEKIDQDMKQAMISKDAPRLDTLRFLKSALKYAAIEKKGGALTDADVQQVIQKQIKQRRESIEQFSKGGRQDLADAETAGVRVLEGYLPKQVGDEELARIVADEAKAQGASSKKDFGRMMKHLTEKLQGAADSRRISEALGKILS
jgi:uncharacterized protein